MRIIESGVDIISEGEDPEAVYLVLAGFAFRYKLTKEGNRQVFAYLIQATSATSTSRSWGAWITASAP